MDAETKNAPAAPLKIFSRMMRGGGLLHSGEDEKKELARNMTQKKNAGGAGRALGGRERVKMNTKSRF